MDLLLWRHAEAADGMPDMERALTGRGRAQARAMADWLRPRLPRDLRILVSPARRARETAAVLALPFEIADAIAPGADAAALIGASGWPGSERPVLIVGHQPALGEVAAALLGKGDSPHSPQKWGQSPLRIAKAAVWWLRRRRRDDTVLVLAIEPSLLLPGQ